VDTVKAAETGAPLTLRVTHGKETRPYAIAWRGGLRHPHLERIVEKPALLDAILSHRPRADLAAVANGNVSWSATIQRRQQIPCARCSITTTITTGLATQ